MVRLLPRNFGVVLPRILEVAIVKKTNHSDVPPFRVHKATRQGYVRLDGRRHYLGRHDLPETKARYDRLIAEWLASGRRSPVDSSDPTIIELCEAYLKYAETYYRKPDGTATGTHWKYVSIVRILNRLYGNVTAATFTPQNLKTARHAMIQSGMARRTVNERVNLIRAMFRWAVSEGMVPVAVHTALTTLAGLRYGRSEAPEGKPVKPVADSTIDATLPHLSPTVRAMVELQRLTGMRPVEVCIMRTCDVNTQGRIWEYRPHTHKTEHHERDRIVFIGPKAQGVLQPFLRRELQAFIFSPATSAAENRERRHEERDTPEGQGNCIGKNRVRCPKRPPGDCFDTNSYRQAIEYGCARAWPVPVELQGDAEAVKRWRREHRWAPNQLRHTFATSVRREHGIEAVKILLGHSDLSTSEIYAERDTGKAQAVALKIG